MRYLILALVLFTSCNQLTIEGELFDKNWHLSTIRGVPTTNCRQPDRLYFSENYGSPNVTIWPYCWQYNNEGYPVTIDGNTLTFGPYEFVVNDITQTALFMTRGSAEYRYYTR